MVGALKSISGDELLCWWCARSTPCRDPDEEVRYVPTPDTGKGGARSSDRSME